MQREGDVAVRRRERGVLVDERHGCPGLGPDREHPARRDRLGSEAGERVARARARVRPARRCRRAPPARSGCPARRRRARAPNRRGRGPPCTARCVGRRGSPGPMRPVTANHVSPPSNRARNPPTSTSSTACAVGIADQAVREPRRAAVERTRPRHAEVREPRAPEILDERLRAGLLDDEPRHQPTASNRTRRPGASSAGGSACGVPQHAHRCAR